MEHHATLDPLTDVEGKWLHVLQIVVISGASNRVQCALKVFLSTHPENPLSFHVLLLLIGLLLEKLRVIFLDLFLVNISDKEQLDYFALHCLHLDIVVLVQIWPYIVADLLGHLARRAFHVSLPLIRLALGEIELLDPLIVSLIDD